MSTLSISYGINLPKMVPEVSKQGLELAYMSKGLSLSSSMKSKPNN
jgi:hypothetical protein